MDGEKEQIQKKIRKYTTKSQQGGNTDIYNQKIAYYNSELRKLNGNRQVGGAPSGELTSIIKIIETIASTSALIDLTSVKNAADEVGTTVFNIKTDVKTTLNNLELVQTQMFAMAKNNLVGQNKTIENINASLTKTNSDLKKLQQDMKDNYINATYLLNTVSDGTTIMGNMMLALAKTLISNAKKVQNTDAAKVAGIATADTNPSNAFGYGSIGSEFTNVVSSFYHLSILLKILASKLDGLSGAEKTAFISAAFGIKFVPDAASAGNTDPSQHGALTSTALTFGGVEAFCVGILNFFADSAKAEASVALTDDTTIDGLCDAVENTKKFATDKGGIFDPDFKTNLKRLAVLEKASTADPSAWFVFMLYILAMKMSSDLTDVAKIKNNIIILNSAVTALAI